MLRVAFNNAVHTTAESGLGRLALKCRWGNELRLFPRRGVLAFPLTRLHAQDLSFRTCEVSQHKIVTMSLLIQTIVKAIEMIVQVIGVLAFVET